MGKLALAQKLIDILDGAGGRPSPMAGIAADVELGTRLSETSSRLNDFDIVDPDDGGAIPVVSGGCCVLTSLGASETRTLAAPTFVGQQITLYHGTDGGDIDVTVSAAINKATNTGINLADAADSITLLGVKDATGLAWRVLVNDGCTLS